MKRNMFCLFAILLVFTFFTIASTALAGDPIPNGNWTCVADSEEPAYECENAIDGNPNTIWHTPWSSDEPPHPHWIEIDLGSEYNVCGFRYLPRQGRFLNGTFGDYEFYVSDDGIHWNRPVANGTFACNHDLKGVEFTPKYGRYVRLKANSECNANPWTSVAEFTVLEAPPLPPFPTSANPMQIALLRWYEAIQTNDAYVTGDGPHGLAFDGANIWVANWNDDTVTKLRASDGSLVGTYNVNANAPDALAFDGANIWVANYESDTVTKLRASDGSLLGIYPVGKGPDSLAFDGANIWISNHYDDTVTKLRASDGSLVGTYPVGNGPDGLAFDGANIWVANTMHDTVTKLRASDGSLVGTYNVGDGPHGLAFDGVDIWSSNYSDGTVTKLRASDGSLVGTYNVGSYPLRLAFDGANIWVANNGSNTVTKLRASDGSLVGTYPANVPGGIAFDGANMWVTNIANDTVQKL